MDIQLDEGYMYGMGLFETIAIYQGKCVLLNMHLERLNKGLRALNIPKQIYKEQIALYLQTADSSHDVLKIMVSEKNTIFSTRKNLYTKKTGRMAGYSVSALFEETQLHRLPISNLFITETVY